DEEESSEDDEDDDMDIKADEEEEEEEEHLAPADSVVVASTATDQAPSAEETEPFETDESAATPPPHPAYRMTARISIPAPVPMPAWTDSEIPFPPLPPILSPPSPILSLAPPPSLIRSLGYRAAMIRLQDEAASTSSPPLKLPSASHREDRPEVTLPPQKRLGIALGPRYEVGESSSAAAARPTGGLRADYGFVATMDREIMRDPEREVGYRITDSWDEIVETLQGAPVSIDTELDGYKREFETRVRQDTDEIYMRDRRAHAYTRHLMETEARMSQEAWVRATDASDLVRGKVMSLRTTVLGQIVEDSPTRTCDSPTGICDSFAGTGYHITRTAGTRWRSYTARATRKQMAPKRTTRSTADQETINTTSITNAQLQAMIDQGVTAALAARDALRSMNGDDSHNSGTGVLEGWNELFVNTYTDFLKCPPLPFKGIEGVASLSQWSAANTNNDNNQRGTGSGQQSGCYECGVQRHFKRECPKLKNNNNQGNQSGRNNASARVYTVGRVGTDPDPDANVVTGTFLLNNRYASILFDTGTDRSFVSTTFSTQINITPSILDHCYDVELADGRIIGLNTILRSCTLNLLNHPFNIDLMPVELGSFDAIIGMDWLEKYQAVIVCAEKIVRIPWGNETLIIHVTRPGSNIPLRPNLGVLQVLFKREVDEEFEKMRDYRRLPDELRESVRMRDAYIEEFQRLQMLPDELRESVRMRDAYIEEFQRLQMYDSSD
nr:putative reverse transcriptase domain-containing protein [Tanacetum cinerariifolium]